MKTLWTFRSFVCFENVKIKFINKKIVTFEKGNKVVSR